MSDNDIPRWQERQRSRSPLDIRRVSMFDQELAQAEIEELRQVLRKIGSPPELDPKDVRTQTQRLMDSSFARHRNNHYDRMMEAFAYCNHLEKENAELRAAIEGLSNHPHDVGNPGSTEGGVRS